MSLSKNQRELLKIAKTLVGLVLDQDEELAQDEDENLNHVKRLLDWHTSSEEEDDSRPPYAPNVVTGKTGIKPIWSEESPDEVAYDSLYKNDPKCRCWFCAKRK